MTNKYYNVQASDYNEARALQQLLIAADTAIGKDNERFERNAEDAGIESFTITINGVQTAFVLGGPQFEALCAFIESISADNGYEVDYKHLLVLD